MLTLGSTIDFMARRCSLQGHMLHKPKVIGSATEGALVILAAEWGFNATAVKDVSNYLSHAYPVKYLHGNFASIVKLLIACVEWPQESRESCALQPSSNIVSVDCN